LEAATLFVVATPIGNLADITLRALSTLREVDRVVAEDTRRTRALLTHHGIAGKPVDSLDAHATPEQIARIVDHLEEGTSVALVTDAGVPAVSDPGAELVRAAVSRGVRVVPIPGASAVTAALSVSGLSHSGFRFFGFLPRAGTGRRDALGRIAGTPEPVVLLEAPMRLAATLAELAEWMPDREVLVAREMTKVHEELLRGPLAEVAAAPREWLGEITLVLGPSAQAGAEEPLGDAEIDARIDEELGKGGRVKEVAERVAAWSGRPRRAIYDRVLGRKGQR
jgi:16S rRNA (cytidine1402-2'-O)-methyltransferase